MEQYSHIELYKIHEDVPTPVYGTSLATCFDLHFFPTSSIVGYTKDNKPIDRFISANKELWINPGERLLVPTGLIMKVHGVPSLQRYSIRLHARSGLALKQGLVLANGEGIVDVDYQKEIFVILTNTSDVTAYLKIGDRICQGELVVNVPAYFILTKDKPTPHSERDGGFGSTGVSS